MFERNRGNQEKTFLSQPNSTKLYSSWSDNVNGPYLTTTIADHFQRKETDLWYGTIFQLFGPWGKNSMFASVIESGPGM